MAVATHLALLRMQLGLRILPNQFTVAFPHPSHMPLAHCSDARLPLSGVAGAHRPRIGRLSVRYSLSYHHIASRFNLP